MIIVQRDDAARLMETGDESWKAQLPAVPSNARYVLHANECLDIGSVGWLLQLPDTHPDHVDTSRYRYFFFLNTSVKVARQPPHDHSKYWTLRFIDSVILCAVMLW